MRKIYFDNRWPVGSGIGVVSEQIRLNLSSRFNFQNLNVKGRIGAFDSFLNVDFAISRSSAQRSEIFWNPGFVPPAFSKVSSVITVHDLTHLRYYSNLHRAYYNLIFKPLYKRCDRIICVSEYTKSEFCEWSGISHSRVDVAYNGVSKDFSEANSAERKDYDYVLYPGNYRSYKNLRRLFFAYSISKLHSLGIKLALTGNGSEDLISYARELNILNNVVFLGYLNSKELVSAYKTSKGVAFVSLYEGFGLPIVEGMASGVPVLTSSISSMPEIAGGAAIVVDPNSDEEIRDGLERLVLDDKLRSELIGRGLQRAGYFTWEKTAAKVREVFDSL